MSSQINAIKHFISTKCEKMSSNSFIVPPELYNEILSLIRNVSITDSSHFGKISYFLADKYPYRYKNASFAVRNNKVYIISGDTWDYTGCRLEGDDTFRGIRINLCGGYIHVLFDYCVDGNYAIKTLSYEIGNKKISGNSQISETIRKYRINYYCSPKEARDAYRDLLFLLRTEEKNFYMRLLSFESYEKNISFPEGAPVYVLSDKYFNKVGTVLGNGSVDIGNKRAISGSLLCSLSPHPFDYITLSKLQNAIRSVDIPSIIVESAFVTDADTETVWIYCHFRDLLTVDICKAIFESVLGRKCEILSDTCLPDKITGITDAYDILSGRWVSDVLGYQQNSSCYYETTSPEDNVITYPDETVQVHTETEIKTNIATNNSFSGDFRKVALSEVTLSLF